MTDLRVVHSNLMEIHESTYATASDRRFDHSCRLSEFGYSIGDLVGWTSSDHEVAAGSQGKVVDFSEDAVAVNFEFGEFLFPPEKLYRIGEEVYGFRLGDSVVWSTVDDYVSDLPAGKAGTIIGTQGIKLIVDFGTRQLLLEAHDLRVVGG